MTRRALAQTALGLLVSLLFAWLALRSVRLADAGRALRDAHYAWLLPAAATLAASVWLRALRWRSLFGGDDRRRVTPSVAFWTLAVGLFFNSVLPARAGEAARAVALNREAGIPRTQALVAIVLERVYDVASLAVLLLLSLALLPSGALVDRLTVAAGALLALLLVLAVPAAAFRRRLRAPAARIVARLPVLGGERADRTVGSVARGLHVSLRPAPALRVALWSLASWVGLAVSNLLCMQAFSVGWPWHAALFVLIVTNFAMVVPATAGSLGVFEAAATAALAAYGIRGGAALSYALVLHALNLVPYLLLGVPALARAGLRAGDVTRSMAGVGVGAPAVDP